MTPAGRASAGWQRRLALHAGVIASYAVIALLHLRPLGAMLGTAFARGNREDTLLHAWIVNWSARALSSDPGSLFDSNSFFPYPRSLAYTEHFLPEALPVAPLAAVGADPVVIYNVAFLLSFVAAGWGMFMLVRHLTGNAAAGWVAGAFLCWFPAKRWHLAHLNTISLQWMPLALLAVHRAIARPATARVLGAGGLVALASLSSAYYTVYFPLLMALAVPLFIWQAESRLDRRRLAVMLGAGLTTGFLMLPILRVYGSLWGTERAEYEYAFFPGAAVDLADFLVLDSWAWSWLLMPEFSVKMTAAFFPGLVVSGLAVGALLVGGGGAGRDRAHGDADRAENVAARSWRRAAAWLPMATAAIVTAGYMVAHHRAWLADRPPPAIPWGWLALLGLVGAGVLAGTGEARRGIVNSWSALASSPRAARVYALLAVAAVSIAIGQRLQFFGFLGPRTPTYWLYDALPLLASLRAPFRAGFLVMVFIGVLAGLGFAAVCRRRRLSLPAGWGLAAVAVFAMQAEFLGSPLAPTPPPAARPVDGWLAEQPGDFGIVELPQPPRLWQTSPAQWRSVRHWKRRVTGHNGFLPSEIRHLHRISSPVLRDDFIDYLVEYFPVRYVLLDSTALSDERRVWSAGRLRELQSRLSPVRVEGPVQVLQVLNGGELGSFRRRFPSWMVGGRLVVELTAVAPEPMRVVARLGDQSLGSARLRAGDDRLEIDASQVAVGEELVWLFLRRADDGPAVHVRRLYFVLSDGSVHP